ncbi:MAG: sporulation integral membrane protein YtvI [Lachnospiraceae bacterium]|nr:sporulation integral membrane protein YtvI [Lachnospiraceae bacterium]
MEGKRTKYGKILLNMGITLGGILIVCLVGPKFISFFMPFFIGFLISMIANPLVRFLERKLKIVRKHSSIVIIIATIALIVTGSYFLIVRTVMEIFGFITELPDMYANMQAQFIDIGEKFERLFELLPIEIRMSLSNWGNTLSNYLSEVVAAIGAPTVEAAGSVARNIPNAFVMFVVTMLSAYFFIADRERIMGFVRQVMPKSVMQHCDRIYAQIKKLIGGYFAAQFKIMGIVALILFVGFLFLRVRYAILFAFLIAFLDFLPFFGTGTALIPWAVVLFLAGDYGTAIGLVIIYLVSQVVRQVIQPKIVGDSMGLDPLATLFFMYVGFKIKGIAGMILAVPAGVILIELFHAGVFLPLTDGIKEIITDINEYRKR